MSCKILLFSKSIAFIIRKAKIVSVLFVLWLKFYDFYYNFSMLGLWIQR
jgi:hypothetical protein